MKICEIESILDSYFKEEQLETALNQYLSNFGVFTKWMLYSDYCLDDQHKPNDVMTFGLIPFTGESAYQEMDAAIQTTQNKDLKKIKSVNPDFLELIKELPVFSYSFIIEDREDLFGDSEQERFDNVINLLEEFKKQYELWCENATDNADTKRYYGEIVEKFTTLVHKLVQSKKIKMIEDIILTALLGALFASKILKKLPKVEIVGWFPDRDKTNEACNNIIVPIFNTIIYNRLRDRNIQWVFVPGDTRIQPFYDNENRIVDFICGTIADFDFKIKENSKEKYDSVLKGLLADNNFIRIYRIMSSKSPLQISSITILYKES